jgi:hypothetical protein
MVSSMEESEAARLKGLSKPGRPGKSPEKLRMHEVKVRFCESELALVKERAAGRPLAIVVRELALAALHGKTGSIPAGNREVVKAIWKYVRELTSLVQSVQAGRSSPHLEPLLEEHLRAIAKYQHDLLEGPAG